MGLLGIFATSGSTLGGTVLDLDLLFGGCGSKGLCGGMDITVEMELRCFDFLGIVDGTALVRCATGDAGLLLEGGFGSLDCALLFSMEEGLHSGQSGRSGGSGAPIAARHDR